MMSRLSTFLMGVMAGAALLYGAMYFHLVRSRDGFHFVGKLPPRLAETYVDARSFSIADWTARPQLSAALVAANKQHLLGDSAALSIQQRVQQLLPARPEQ